MQFEYSTDEIIQGLRDAVMEKLVIAVKELSEVGEWAEPAEVTSPTIPMMGMEKLVPRWFSLAVLGAQSVAETDKIQGIGLFNKLLESTERAGLERRAAALNMLLQGIDIIYENSEFSMEN